MCTARQLYLYSSYLYIQFEPIESMSVFSSPCVIFGYNTHKIVGQSESEWTLHRLQRICLAAFHGAALWMILNMQLDALLHALC